MSNAHALPWAKPWLQLCDVDNERYTTTSDYGCLETALTKWLLSRGVSNALALPWAKPWLQLCDVDNERYTTTSDYGCLETALARILHGFSNQASGYQSYSRVPANMPFATRRLNRMHRHCLEKSRRESEKLSSAPVRGARWLGHCVAGAE